MPSTPRAFVIMPFGKKKAPGGAEVDFDAVYESLLAPALVAANLAPHRTDADLHAGSIYSDTLQEVLRAKCVVADLTIDNANVLYEVGVRHAFQAGGTVLVHARRDPLPFDVGGERAQRYTLKGGVPDSSVLEKEKTALKDAAIAVLEPSESHVEVTRNKRTAADILVLADEIPNDASKLDALRAAAKALLALHHGPHLGRPEHVVLFSGHMIDNPNVRGPGKGKPARFPIEKVAAAAARIRAALDEIGAGAGDLGICGAASGGDLLFAKACLERDMSLEVQLARAENEFLEESVTFADPERLWKNTFDEVTSHPKTKTWIMPDELGPAPEGVSVHDRCNRWMLYNALSHGLHRASFVTLWNGEPSEGPGGTQSMVELVAKLTAREPVIIDPAKL